jgi:peptidoglycan hydrolase-like protein with peptidoglycan-binding domain
MLVANFEHAGAWLPALAMYNSGQTNDQYTTGHDYAHDVLERRESLDTMFPATQTDRLLAPSDPPMVGNDVRFYQAAMNAKHFWGTPLTVDGVYGPKTVAVVKHFQTQHGLVADGIIGPNTRAAMAKVPMP